MIRWLAFCGALALSGCDSAEDTGLGACSFTATTQGDVREDLGGRARYYSGVLGDLAYARIEMDVTAVNGQIASLNLIGTSEGPSVDGTAPFNPPAGTGPAWSGQVNGGLSLQSTGGTVRILEVSDERIEGTFMMETENDRGEYVITVYGRFNAHTDCPQR